MFFLFPTKSIKRKDAKLNAAECNNELKKLKNKEKTGINQRLSSRV